jgi:hypothetical protein
VDLELADEWGDGAKQTRIVVIGARGELNAQALQAQIDACHATACPRPASAPSCSRVDAVLSGWRAWRRKGRSWLWSVIVGASVVPAERVADIADGGGGGH